MRDETAAKRLQTAQDRDRMADDPDREAELRGRAVRDVIRDLTGAWVRKFGLPEVARELERAARVGAKLVLAFIDVDGLKALMTRWPLPTASSTAAMPLPIADSSSATRLNMTWTGAPGPLARLSVRVLDPGQPTLLRQPTEPSIWIWIKRFISTAYSSGSSFTIGSMKPATIIAEASDWDSPRDIR
jgi:hypothetical protein